MIRTKTINSIWRSKFFRNVAVVASGSVGSQVILLAFSPLITRIYGPEAYGYQGVFVTVAAFLVPLAAMAYPTAIVLAKDNADALILVKISIITTFIIASLTSVVLLIAGDDLLDLLNSTEISEFLWLIPIYVFFSGCLQVVNQWRIRKKQFKTTARILIIHSFLISIIKVGFGFISPKGGTLISLSTLGVALQSILLTISMKDKSLTSAMLFKGHTKHSRYYHIAKKYSDFPKYRAPQDFFNAVTQGIPLLMLSGFFGPAAAGFYALARTVMLVPISLLSKSVGDVFYPKVSEAYNSNRPIAPPIVRSTIWLAVVGLVPFGLVSMTGPFLFGFVFGDQWSVAGQYAQWLSVWLYFAFINSPANISMPVQGLLKFSMYLQIAGTLARVMALIIGFYLLDSDIYSIALYSVAGMLFNITLIAYAIVSAKRHDKKLLENTI